MEVKYVDYPDSCVYWIYLKGVHTDPFKQGYIGVSTHGAEKRFKNHLWHARRNSQLIVHRAIRKYGDQVAVKTLIKGSPEYCLHVENLMRPSANLSGTWNISAGGGLPMAGRSHSEEAKQKVSVANRGRIPSKETREKMRKSQLGRKHSEETKSKIGVGNRTPHTDEAKAKMSASWNKGRDWNHPRANEKVWVKAIEMSAYILQHPEHGCERMMQNFNLPKSTSPTIYKKIKSGWNPSLDPSYLSWLQEYKVKEANNYAKT